METYINQVASYLLAQSWQIALLAVIVGLISLALRSRSAHIRYLLWLIVLAKCLIPPIHSVPVAVLPERSLTTNLAQLELLQKPTDNSIVINTSESVIVDEPMIIEDAVEANQVKSAVPNARDIIVLVWLAGVVLFLIWIGSRAVRYTLWLHRRRTPLPPVEHQSFQELFSRFKLKRSPNIWLTKDIAQPFVWGLLRGSVYLPADFFDSDGRGHNRTILGHELSHIARFDAFINILQVAAQAICWFHHFGCIVPLFWGRYNARVYCPNCPVL
ncbi:M56 family metallopeptidase [Planctomycetota bacterium]